jgi:Lrp/AsnC family transcriptional regulator for asnA, asnC and gidA
MRLSQIAFILINCNAIDIDNVIASVSVFSELVRVHKLEGPYDIILKINGEDVEKIKEFVSANVKKIDKIKHILTLPVNKLN